jgi:DNA-binding response OmpR family regulator
MGQARFNAVILNVDGHSVSRARRTDFLRDAGFEVLEADSAVTALRRASRADVMLIAGPLEDISVPGLCRRVKQHPATRSTMILDLSRSRGDRPACCLEAGADWFSSEPLEGEDLVAAINSLVRVRWTQEQLRQRVDELERIVPGTEGPLSPSGSAAPTSDEFAAPLDCVAMWVRILMTEEVERPLRQHGLAAIEHNISLIRDAARELLSLARRSGA